MRGTGRLICIQFWSITFPFSLLLHIFRLGFIPSNIAHSTIKDMTMFCVHLIVFSGPMN